MYSLLWVPEPEVKGVYVRLMRLSFSVRGASVQGKAGEEMGDWLYTRDCSRK